MEERLQKILSQWGIASRRQAEKMILDGRVKLNGQPGEIGQRANPERDQIEVDGVLLTPAHRPQLVYLLLHKPKGVVSTCSDPQGRPTVLELMPESLARGQGLHPIGRLDSETTGALLLSNDGELTFGLTHPRHGIPKTYEVLVKGHPPEKVLKDWREGIMLEGKKTRQASVCQIKAYPGTTLLQVILKEGRNRQIRKVAEQLGYPVINLHRTAIGPILLKPPGEPILPVGKYRLLKKFELQFLQSQLEVTSVSVPTEVEEQTL
ncbi:MAG TPA: pseudouridine synthase [Halomicronema sp.]